MRFIDQLARSKAICPFNDSCFFSVVYLTLYPRCEFCLDHFMKEIKQSPSSVDYPSMVNVLIAHSQSNGTSNLILPHELILIS